MRRTLRLVSGLAIASTPDFGVGIWLVTIMSYCFGVEAGWGYYLAGMVFAVLPDLDIILWIIANTLRIPLRNHRDILHHPFYLLVLGCVLIWVTTPEQHRLFWSVLYSSALCWHFLHDSIGEANACGMKLLSPFSRENYRLFMRDDDGNRLSLIRKLEPGYVLEKSSHTVEYWLETYYLRLTFESAFGSLVFLTGLSTALLRLVGWI